MAINAKEIPGKDRKFSAAVLSPGSYPARLVQLISLGVQKQNPFKGEEKPPVAKIRVTYELLDEFMKDDKGDDVEDKPRWISEEFPFLSLKADRATSTKRYYALDPDGVFEGDWTKLLGTPCVVTVVNEKDKRPGSDRIFENISSVSSMRAREAAKAPELKNPPRIFDFDDPNKEVFEEFPEWLQEKIKSAVDYEGSPLEALLSGKPPVTREKKEEPLVDTSEEDNW